MSLASIDFNEAYIQQPIVVEPTIFQEAYDHPDPFERDKWRNAIKNELSKMEWKSPTIFGFDEDAADLLTMKVTDELHDMLLEKLVWINDKNVEKMLLSNTHNRKGVRGCCLYCCVDCGT